MEERKALFEKDELQVIGAQAFAFVFFQAHVLKLSCSQDIKHMG